MASTFRPMNSGGDPVAGVNDSTIPASPSATRPNTAPTPRPQSTTSNSDDAATPTRATFTPSITGQRPLPSSPFPQGVQIPERISRLKREHSTNSSSALNDGDVVMEEQSDEEGGAEDEENDDSDDDSLSADGSKSDKKKRSQRFYCTDYPPCNLSFTRSEHLARHIRKHTGERPFQCHCSRRFSRLDNLRQHAQTVHVNEDIPIDSLAASGSRFQRQIRTDRVRQAGNRARASTGGSAGGPPRGHSKSLSTSSINSISSIGSSYSTAADARRRPTPLVMANDTRSRGSLESYRSNADSTYSAHHPPSPGDFSATPTSATFSTGQSSPRWSGMASPAQGHSRSQSLYSTDTRTPGRRLSVPSGANPFQSPHASLPVRMMVGSGGHIAAPGGEPFSPYNNSLVSSPTTSTSSWSRRGSFSGGPDEAWRRRTWHPDSRSYSSSTSQLSSVVNQSSMRSNPAPPIATSNLHNGPQSSLRLPGIESFDPVPRQPITPPKRITSPMAIDSALPRRMYAPPTIDGPGPDERRNLNMYDASLQRGLNRLDIGLNTPPRDSAGSWASEANKAVQAQAEQVRSTGLTVRFEDQQLPSYRNTAPGFARSLHHQTMSAPSIASSRENKRHGWQNGSVAIHRELQSTNQDPRAAHVDRLVHPNLTGFSGFPGREPRPVEQHHQLPQRLQAQRQEQPPLPPQFQQFQQAHPPQVIQQPPQQQQPQGPANGNGEQQTDSGSLGRLEALVAAATGEASTAAAY